MSKVFSFHNLSNGEDWFNSDAYHNKEIEKIKDSEGGTDVSLPTAVPSPFARIDLVKTAFNNINKSPNLKYYKLENDVLASREDERLVSDCLDLGELLFNSDSLGNDLKVMEWNREVQLKLLKDGGLEHRRYAETLEMYLDQDKAAYNFAKLKSLFFVQYKHTLLGSTSPSTLFFTSGADLSGAQIKLTTDDILFDEKPATLYERDPEFQVFMHHLFKAYGVQAALLKEVKEYLRITLENVTKKKDAALYDRIKNLKADDFERNYDELNTGSEGKVVYIFEDMPFKKRKKASVSGLVSNSDFVIKSDKYKGANKPLVLQRGLNKPFKYINQKWDDKIDVPYYDSEPDLGKRWLPGQKIQFPYLTVSDFLEPYLIRTVYPINRTKFFDGNYSTDNKNFMKGYLLPLKKQFFDYFDVDFYRDTLRMENQCLRCNKRRAGLWECI